MWSIDVKCPCGHLSEEASATSSYCAACGRHFADMQSANNALGGPLTFSGLLRERREWEVERDRLVGWFSAIITLAYIVILAFFGAILPTFQAFSRVLVAGFFMCLFSVLGMIRYIERHGVLREKFPHVWRVPVEMVYPKISVSSK